MGEPVRGGGAHAQKSHRFAGPLAALLLLPVAALAFAAPPAAQQPGANASLPKVTIQGSRELRRQVHKFIAAVVAQPGARESLLRWDTQICPLVVGVQRDWGEFILEHISQAARDAHAPLAGTHCQPNLFVVVTPQPDSVLKQWMARHPRVNTKHGLASLKSFLSSTQPIRVWYNSEPSCPGGVARPGSAALSMSARLPDAALAKHVAAAPAGGMGPTYCDNSIDTHLNFGDVQSISYAIVVADTNQLHQKKVTLEQLADYVSLVGLVDIRSDAGGGGVPTILDLFRAANPPQGLTPWDRALMYSLYNTSQSGKLQLTDMEVSMVRRIAP